LCKWSKIKIKYYNPVEVIETNNWQVDCKNFQQKLGIQNPLVVTSNGNMKRQNLSSVFNSQSIFSDVGPDPTFETCQLAIDFSIKFDFDGVIAIGGGSVMDTAKVIMASRGTGINNLIRLLTIKPSYNYSVSSIFIPTTHGTGSEVTMWGTIWDMQGKNKYSVSHPKLYPSVAILDGSLLLSLPLDISIITVMDALSHSFEAIWNNNRNDTSITYAIDAITMIFANVEELKKHPYDLEIRNNLLRASNKAGLAFSNTKTAASHSISYPLTINYGIPHGIASSLCLIPLLELNKKLIYDSLEKLCEKSSSTYNQLIKKIESIPNGVFTYRLRGWGIKEYQIDELVEQSFSNERMENNIKSLSKKDVKRIFLKIF
jgi:alcohol dehydrogenase class IV